MARSLTQNLSIIFPFSQVYFNVSYAYPLLSMNTDLWERFTHDLESARIQHNSIGGFQVDSALVFGYEDRGLESSDR